MKKLFFLTASSCMLFAACKRDLIPAGQDQADLAPRAVTATAVTAGSVPSFGVQTVNVSTVQLVSGIIHIALQGGVATDAAGNIYIADQGSNVIRKINTNGMYSIYAGSGTAGFQDGPALTAQFNTPEGLAFDAQGNLYVADENNNRIRMITPGGVVSTYAGSGVKGFADGPDTLAKFNQPTGVALDANGVVYVADFSNQRIRRVLKTKAVSTWAGSGKPAHADGTGSLASFSFPFGIAATPAGVVYVTDESSGHIRKIVAGVVSTLAGDGQSTFRDGTGAQASFHTPLGIGVDAIGNVYVADDLNHRVRKITPAGVVTTMAGNGSLADKDGFDGEASFGIIHGLGISPAGDIYVGNPSTTVIRKLNVFAAVRTLAGDGSFDYAEGTGAGAHIFAPYSISLDANGLLFFEDGDLRYRKCTPAGTTSFLAGGAVVSGGRNGRGDSASFVAYTGTLPDAAGNLFVAEGSFVGDGAVRKIDPTGLVTTFATDTADHPSPFHFNSSLNFDAAGNMIFTSFRSGILRKLSPAGVVTRFDSLPLPEQSTNIFASTTDVAGNLYVPDATSSTIFKVTPRGAHTVFFSGQIPTASGSGTTFQPHGLAVDAKGNVYVADFGNNRIVIFSSAGVVIGQVGTGAPAFADGLQSNALFNSPTWVAINRSTGILYIADQGNNRIRMMSQLP